VKYPVLFPRIKKKHCIIAFRTGQEISNQFVKQNNYDIYIFQAYNINKNPHSLNSFATLINICCQSKINVKKIRKCTRHREISLRQNFGSFQRTTGFIKSFVLNSMSSVAPFQLVSCGIQLVYFRFVRT
jgi:hypothetical protein